MIFCCTYKTFFTYNPYIQKIMQISTLCICKQFTVQTNCTKTKTFWNLNLKARTQWTLHCNDDEILLPFSYDSICMTSLLLQYVSRASKNPGIHKKMIDKSKSILWKCLAFNYVCIWNPNIFSVKHYLR